MPLHTTDALILRTYTLGESDRIVVFLTRDRGKKRGVAKNARQSRRRFGGGLEPMTCGRVAYVERERRDLVLLNYVEPTRSPLSIMSVMSVRSGASAARGEGVCPIGGFGGDPEPLHCRNAGAVELRGRLECGDEGARPLLGGPAGAGLPALRGFPRG